MGAHKFEVSATIESARTGFQNFATLCFWLWGGFGLLLHIGTFLGLSGSITVGTSTYITASLLLWIGGMIFFGLLGLNSRSVYEFKRPPN